MVFCAGWFALIGFRQTSVLFDRPPRFEGAGKYNRFLGSLRIGFNGVFCFSNYALTLSTIFGFIAAGFSFALMAIYLFYKLMGWQILWGNPTLVILISFLGGIQLISVGILGEYIGRIYEESSRTTEIYCGSQRRVFNSAFMAISSKRPAASRWPKTFPPLGPDQQRIRDDFMKYWHEVVAPTLRIGLNALTTRIPYATCLPAFGGRWRLVLGSGSICIMSD